jgi:hypothetical protein
MKLPLKVLILNGMSYLTDSDGNYPTHEDNSLIAARVNMHDDLVKSIERVLASSSKVRISEDDYREILAALLSKAKDA